MPSLIRCRCLPWNLTLKKASSTEILLARQIAVMFGGQELDFRNLIDGVKGMRMRVRHAHDLPEIAPRGPHDRRSSTV